MRKFLLTLAVLCGTVSAWAQWSGKKISTIKTTPATMLADGYYVIYNNGRGTFLNTEAAKGSAVVTWPTTANATGVDALASDDVLNNGSGTKNKNAYVFYVNVEEQKLSLQTGFGDYVPALTSNSTFNYIETEDFWSFEIKESCVFLKNGNVGLDCNGWSANSHTYSTAAGWDADSNKNTAGNQSWSFFPVELADADIINVTYVYMVNDKEYKREVKSQNANSVPNASSFDYLTIANYEGTIADEDCEIIVNCNQNLPFVVSSSFAEATWQVIDMHSNENNYTWKFVAEDAYIELPVVAKTQTASLGDNYYWAFVGDIVDGFKIYNKAAGESLTLRKATNGNTTSVMSSVNDRNVFKLSKSTSSISNSFCFNIEGDNHYVNTQKEGNVKILKGWSAKDEGSSCRIFAPASYVLNNFANTELAPSGAVGSYSYLADSEKYLQFSSAYALVKANHYDIDALNSLDNLNMISDIIASEKVAFADGYYRILSAQPGLYANNKGLIYDKATSASNPFRWGTVKMSNVNAIVKLITDGEKVVLQAVNPGTYMQGVAGAENVNMTDNGHFQLIEKGQAQYNLKFGNGTMHANNHSEGSGAGSNVIGWDGERNSASAWYIVPATELEVTVKQAGHASIHLPFDVTLPKDVEAYAVTSVNETSVTMTKKDNIPANTGAILKGVGTHALKIAQSTSNWDDNLLEGSNVTTYVEGPSYVLSTPQGKEQALYLATLNKNAEGTEGYTHFQNNANKAYLPIVSESRFLVFNFGEETGIDELKGENGNVKTEVYDLAGRRVQNTQKGVFIVNGKVVIK